MPWLPAASWLKFYLAVFFTFMPVFILFGGGVRSNGTWLAILFWSLVSGLIGVSWAVAFSQRKRWLLFFIIPAQIGLIAMSGSGWPAVFRISGANSDFTGIYFVLTIGLGYAFFSWFISAEGARALRLSEEMRLAAQIHERLVPEIRVNAPRVEVFAASIASSEMGGDLIDAVTERDGSISLYLVDVSGHGVRAGVLMAMIKSAIRASHLRSTSLAGACAELNTVIDQVKEPDMFATYASLRIDAGGAVSCAIAGHLPIVQISGDTGAMVEHQNESLPLGVVADETFAARDIEAKPGDCFALYTDGLTEAFDADRRQFGAGAVNQILRDRRGDSLESIYHAVMDAVGAHEGARRGDDQTLMLVRIR